MTFPQLLIFIIAPILGYLLGSVPFALLIGKAHSVDIRTVGSKNIGATNLGRTLGKKFFWQAFLLDAAKGFLPVLLVAFFVQYTNSHSRLDALDFDWRTFSMRDIPHLSQTPAHRLPSWSPLLTAIACVLGHNFPIWLKFKGGKGVATSFGVVLGFWPLYTFAALAAGVVFVVVFMAYRYISLGSIVGVLAFVAFVYGFAQFPNLPTYTHPEDLYPLLAIAGLFAALIIYRHKTNIVRLLKGTEPRFGHRDQEKANMK